MKIGISRNTYGIDGAADLIHHAGAAGFRGIQFKSNQLRAFDYSPKQLDRISPLARAMGRAGVVFHPKADFHTWPGITELVLRFVAAVNGEHVCYCFCPQEEEGQTVDQIADELTRTGAMFARHGIAFSFHNHVDSMFATLEQLSYLCERLHPKYCGLTFDTAHAAASGIEDLPAAIHRLRSHINNVHLKDFNDEGEFCPLGTGRLPLNHALEALRKIHFAEWMIVDEESAGVECADACRISMEFLQSHGLIGAANIRA